MATRFDNSTILFSEAHNPVPPNVASDIKLFQEAGELKIIGFNGQVANVVTTKQLQKLALSVSIPDVLLVIKPIEINLKKLIDGTAVTSKAALLAFQNELTQQLNKLPNEASLQEIKDELNVLNGYLQDELKATDEKILTISSDVNTQATQFLKYIVTLQNSLKLLVSKKELNDSIEAVKKSIPQQIEVAAGEVTYGEPKVIVSRTDNVYVIDVQIPETVVNQTVNGGGLSKTTVSKMIATAVAGISGGSGTGFTPIEGTGIVITPVGANYSFSVNDYISKSEVASLSGCLQSQIDAITGGATSHNTLSGLQGGISGQYYHMTATQNANFLTCNALGNQLVTGSSTSNNLSGAKYLTWNKQRLVLDPQFGAGEIYILSGNTDDMAAIWFGNLSYSEIYFAGAGYTPQGSVEQTNQLAFYTFDENGMAFLLGNSTGSIKYGNYTTGKLMELHNDGGLQIGGQTNVSPGYGSVSVLSLSGSAGNLVAHDATGKLIDGGSLSGYTTLATTAAISAGLSSRIDAIATLSGRTACDGVNSTFTISHSSIDTSSKFPLVTMDVVDATSDLHIIGVYDRQATSFKVVLNGVAPATYGIMWHIV
jgi:hypothetical protein